MAAPTTGAPLSRHRIRLLPEGRLIEADAGESVLDAALAAGINLPHSCKTGHCAACRARLVFGQVREPETAALGLTAAERAQGLVLLCQVRAASDLAVEARALGAAGESRIKRLPARIAGLERLASDVLKVWLRLPTVERFEFAPGQYLDVLLEDGARRSFSIASPPHDRERLELHVRHAPGGRFTERLFGELAEGALLSIEGPLGQFVYHDDSRPALFIAGGTGFAPVKSMLRHALERGTPRPLHLYWGARTAADLYEESWVLELARRHPALRFRAVLSATASGGAPHRETGWVHERVLAEHPSLRSFDVYVAGPPQLVSAVRAEFPARGLPPGRLHFASFDYAPR